MNCAPGKIGTPSVASVGGASGSAVPAVAGAVVAGCDGGGGAGAGLAGCDGGVPPGRGNGCGVWASSAPRGVRAPRMKSHRDTETQRNTFFLRVLESPRLYIL